MEKYIFDENNGLWYERRGDYYLPCLTISEEEQVPVGVWGQRICAISRNTTAPNIWIFSGRVS